MASLKPPKRRDGPTVPDWIPGNTGKPGAAELNKLTAPRVMIPAANTVVPVIYGRDRQFGRPFFAIADNEAGFLYVGYVFCIGRIEAFEALLVDGVDVDDTGNGLLGRYASKGAQVNTHLGEATQSADTLCIEAVGTLDGGGTYTDTLDGIAYVVLKVPKGATAGFPRLEAVVQGRRVYDPRQDSTSLGSGDQRADDPATWAYSNNPTLCFADFVTQQVGWGIDWASVVEGANANDETLAGGSKRRTLGLTLGSAQTASAWLQGFRVYMGAYTPWEDGVIRVVPERADVDPTAVDFAADILAGNWAAHNVAHHFTEDDIVEGSLQLGHRSARHFPNSITVEYTDSSYTQKWITDRVRVETQRVIDGLEKRRPSTVSLPGIHSRAQAKREAVERLNWFVNDLEGSFTAFDEGLQLQIGCIIAISHPIGLDVALFRVVDARVSDGRWSFNIVEYRADAYSDEVVDDPAYNDGGGSNLPLLTTPPSVQALTADEELFTYPNKLTGSRVRATWTALPDGYADLYLIEGWVDDQKVWQGTSKDPSVVTAPVEGYVGTTPVVYTVKVFAMLRGVIGDEAAVNTTIAGKTAPPLAVPSLTATKLDANAVALTWVEPAENDVAVYEVRRGTTAVWGDGVLVERTKAKSCTARFLPVGEFTFMVKAIDSYGNESPTPATDTASIALPGTPASFTGQAVNGQVRLRWDANPATEFVRGYALSYGTDPVVSLGEVSGTRIDLDDLPVGEHTFALVAVDSAGRESAVAATTEVEVVKNADTVLDDLIQDTVDNAQAILDEAIARATAITDAVAAEAALRADAILNEQLAREAAITNEATVRQAEDDSLAQSISEIVAGTGEQFDSRKIWYFDEDLEGWTGSGATVVGGFLRPGSAGLVDSPSLTALAIDGSKYNYVKARLRKVGSPTWETLFAWRYDGEAPGFSHTLSVLEPSWDANGVATIDLTQVGFNDVVEQVRFDLFTGDASNYVEFDWIAIGRPSPGASVAMVQDETTARIAGDAAEATQRSTLAAQLRGAYTGTDVAEVTVGLIYSEREARVSAVGAVASDVSSLQARMPAGTGQLATAASVTSEASARVSADNALSSRTDALEARMPAGVGELATASALSALSGEVDTLEGTVTSQATQLSSLTASIAAAVQGLTLPTPDVNDWIVTSGPGELSIIASGDISVMGGYLLRVGNSSGNDMAWVRYRDMIPYDPDKLYRVHVRGRMESGSAGGFYIGLAALKADRETYVTTAGADNGSLSGSHYLITNSTSTSYVEATAYFKGKVSGARTGAGTLASPWTMPNPVAFLSPMVLGNYNGQTGRFYLDKFLIEDATALEANATTASAVSLLDARVTSVEGVNASQATSITSLTSQMAGKASATALTALTTRVSDVEAAGYGVNMIPNSTMSSGETMWGYTKNGDSHWEVPTINRSGATWVPPGMRNWGTNNNGTNIPSTDYINMFAPLTPVQGDTLYIGSIYTANHRSESQIYVQWLDASKAHIVYTAGESHDSGTSGVNGGQSLAAWVRLKLIAESPANARFARVLVQVRGNGTGDNGYGWMLRPMLEEARPDQTQPSPWNAGGAESLASYTLALTVDNYISGWQFTNDGSTGDFAILADSFSIVSPGGGARTEYSNGNWRVYDASGVLRVAIGVNI